MEKLSQLKFNFLREVFPDALLELNDDNGVIVSDLMTVDSYHLSKIGSSPLFFGITLDPVYNCLCFF